MLAACACAPEAAESEERAPRRATDRPNVVVVMIDTLRPDHLDLYGYGKETAPFLRELGQRSVVMRHASSTSSWTAPATASLFTGLYPTEHGVVAGFRASRRKQRSERRQAAGGTLDQKDFEVLKLSTLPKDLATLPEVFQQSGYKTYGISSNINIDRYLGFGRGFDQFECLINFDAAAIREALEPWEEEIRDGPSFLYLHFMEPHVPYEAHDPWYEEQAGRIDDLRSRYDSEIRFLDQHLETLHDRLDWDHNTLLVVLSDHGEEFMERGEVGHHFSLYVELTRILMMVHAPGLEHRFLETNTSIIDVFPTLTALAGLDDPNPRSGLDLGPLLGDATSETPAEFDERVLYAHRQDPDSGENLWAVMDGPWKLLKRDFGEAELYDRRSDEGEHKNVADKRTRALKRLQKRLDAFQTRGVRSSQEAVEVPVDDDMREVLQALGYVSDD